MTRLNEHNKHSKSPVILSKQSHILYKYGSPSWHKLFMYSILLIFAANRTRIRFVNIERFILKHGQLRGIIYWGEIRERLYSFKIVYVFKCMFFLSFLYS